MAGVAVGDPPEKTGDVPRLVAFASLLVTHTPMRDPWAYSQAARCV